MIGIPKFNRLYIKLTITLIAVFCVLSAIIFYYLQNTSMRYSNALIQTLNQDVAQHITDELKMINQGQVNSVALKTLAHQAMVIHPAIEVFLLNPKGKIISHALDESNITQTHIPLTPIIKALNKTQPYPIYGIDPRDNRQEKLFSAAKVINDGKLEGYVYVILNGEKQEVLAKNLVDNPIMKSNSLAIAFFIIIGFITCLIIFYSLSHRLSQIVRRINIFYQNSAQFIEQPSKNRDELQQLDLAFRALQDRIDNQMEQIKSADKTRRELITHISHDLRTPLTSIQGYIDTLLLKGDTLQPNEYQQYLQITRDHIQKLSNLISDLFELTKLDSNAIKPEFETFSLTELIHDISQGFQIKAENKSIFLKFNNMDQALVRADIRLIDRAISNLIDNALNHTPEGGRIEINLHMEQSGARVSISDTGNGIDEKDLPFIFDRLFHVQNPNQQHMKSTGLGLAIVKRILELHKSQINVISQIHKGSTFTFSLSNAT